VKSLGIFGKIDKLLNEYLFHHLKLPFITRECSTYLLKTQALFFCENCEFSHNADLIGAEKHEKNSESIKSDRYPIYPAVGVSGKGLWRKGKSSPYEAGTSGKGKSITTLQGISSFWEERVVKIS